MYKVFVFDLDDTLIASEELEGFRGRANLNNEDPDYERQLIAACRNTGVRTIIDCVWLTDLRTDYPSAKFCVFTTSPRRYAQILLQHFYPTFAWDSVVGFEDVISTKPDPSGLLLACEWSKIADDWEVSSVVMIGDQVKDIRAAYRFGSACILFTRGWPEKLTNTHYRANSLLPDASVKTLSTLRQAIDKPDTKLPILEAYIAGASHDFIRAPKFPHFCNLPDEITADGKAPMFWVSTLGRMFSDYENLDNRREWHELTQQILDNKTTSKIPSSWLQAVRAVISKDVQARPNFFNLCTGRTPPIITCIPHKHGRPERMDESPRVF